MAALTLALLGPPQITRADGTAVVRARKELALLAYLAVERRRPHSRDTLVGVFWPESAEEAARNSLRVALAKLRAALGEAAELYLLTGRHSVQFSTTSDHTLDVAAFEALLAERRAHCHEDGTLCAECAARLTQAIALYRGDFLSGFALPDSTSFEEWAMVVREQLHQQVLEALDVLAAYHDQRDDYAALARCARRQIELEPWREQAHRQLMRAVGLMGDRVAALAAYERCRQVLEAELGLEPEEETRALYEQVLRGELKLENEELRKPSSLHSQFSILHSQFRERSEAPEPGQIYGREQEVAQVRRWLIEERCQLVGVFGIGGVGKTALAATVIQAVGGQFGRVIWRSLLNAPPLDELLRLVLSALAAQTVFELPISLEEQLTLLLECLRQQRCLLILDNLESVLHAGGVGQMRTGYEDYTQLLDRLAHSKHQSCVLLTSRERPQGLARWEADLPWVRTLRLEGLDAAAGQAMLNARGLTSQEEDARMLVARYSGNPLALKLVAQTVHELFGGAITDFLREEAPIFDDIRAVLDQQYARLSELEQEILVWLAIEREAIVAARLRANLVQPASPQVFLEALRALQRRSLLEKTVSGFTLQNVVIEYVTERLVEGVYAELAAGLATVTRWQGGKEKDDNPVTSSAGHALAGSMLNRFALLKAQAKEYVRQSQARMILGPIADRLLAQLGSATLAAHVQSILTAMHAAAPLAPGYAGGNLLNLLLHLRMDVSGYDFSQLSVWQADLRGVASAAIDFSHADLAHSAFTAVFDLAALHFTAAGQLLVAGLVGDELSLWRAVDGGLHDLFRCPGAGTPPVVFSHDSQLLATCSLDYSVRVWSAASGERLHTLQGHSDLLYMLAFSADGRRLASSSRDGTVRVWDVQSGQLLHRLHEHSAGISALAFSTDGTMLAGGGDRVICLWHTSSGQVIRTLLGHHREITCLAFSADDRQLVSGAHDGSIRLWDIASGQTLRILEGHHQLVCAVVLHPDGQTLASGGADRVVRLWDLRDGQMLRPPLDQGSVIISLAFSSDGQVLVSGNSDRTVKLWETGSGNLLDTLRGHVEIVRSVHFSPDGRLLASSSATGIVRLWALGTPGAAAVARGEVVRSWPGHAGEIRSVVFSPDGRLLASGGVDQMVHVWDVDSGRLQHTFRGHTNTIKALAFRPDGRVLASGGSDRTIWLWLVSNTSTPAEQTGRVLRGHADEISSLAFSPDGRTLLSSSLDHTARIWVIDGDQELQVLTARGSALSGAVFSPDGQLAVATSYDGTVQAWDVASGQRRELGSGRDVTALRVVFSPDGATLACATIDQAIEIRDAATGAVLQTLRGHQEAILSIAYSPTPPILASSCWDGTIRVWDVETGECLHALHAPGPYAGMNITGVTRISDAQKAALKALGAVEGAALVNEALGAEEWPAAPDHLLPSPSASPPAPTYNLPSPLSSFVGRENELAEIDARLQQADVRLLTLVGAGGMGKTRLALEVMRLADPSSDQLDQIVEPAKSAFPDGVFFVSLAPLTTPAAIVPAIAAVVGLSLHSDPKQALLRFLRDRQLLLVLDNFEHLLDGVELVVEILQSAPRVKLLATSRERLKVRGEHIYVVEGMEYYVEDPATASAIRLFVQSARRVRADFKVSEEKLPLLLHICDLVQGMPLGIELAASWVETLPLEMIAAEIERSVDFLAYDWRDAPERQRSMRAVFDWSWQLLNEAERQALRGLSVFRGGCTLEAAETVVKASLRVLTSLVDKSLLRRNWAQSEVGRYEMHELLRQFAAEQLDTTPAERVAVEARHSAFYLTFVAERETRLAHNEPSQAAEEIRGEIDNVRQAWAWAAIQTHISELACSVYGLWQFYWLTGLSSEGEQAFGLAAQWVRRRMSTIGSAQEVRNCQSLSSKLLAGQAHFMNLQAKYNHAIPLAQQAVALGEVSRDHIGAAMGYVRWGQALFRKGLCIDARPQFERALHFARVAHSSGPDSESLSDMEWDALVWLGFVATSQGDYDEARTHLAQGLRICQTLGNRRGECRCFIDTGEIAMTVGDYAGASTYFQAALRLAHEHGNLWYEGMAHLFLGMVAFAEGHYTLASDSTEAALNTFHNIGDPAFEAWALASFGRLADSVGDYAHARDWLDQSLFLSQKVGAWEARFYGCAFLALVLHHLGDDETASRYAEQSRRIAIEAGDRSRQADAWLALGRTRESLNRLTDAVSAYQYASALYAEVGRAHMVTEPRAGLARIALVQGDLAQAQMHIEDILTFLKNHSLIGPDEPFMIYLTCYRVLEASDDPRAATVLETAQRLLQVYADQIADDALRRSFLENVAAHQAILTLAHPALSLLRA